MIIDALRIAMALDAIVFFGLLAGNMIRIVFDEKENTMLPMLIVLSAAFLLVGALCLEFSGVEVR